MAATGEVVENCCTGVIEGLRLEAERNALPACLIGIIVVAIVTDSAWSTFRGGERFAIVTFKGSSSNYDSYGTSKKIRPLDLPRWCRNRRQPASSSIVEKFAGNQCLPVS